MVYMKLSVLSRDDSQHQKLKDNCLFFGTKYFKYAWMCFRSEKIIVYFGTKYFKYACMYFRSKI